jgi:hypothetical protein
MLQPIVHSTRRARVTRLSALVLPALLLAGCLQAGTASSSDAGTDGGVCDGKESCDSCLTCAKGNPCASQVNACVNDAACYGLDQCLQVCGSNYDCREQCYLGNPIGVDLYNALLDCLYCVECRTDCAGTMDCT